MKRSVTVVALSVALVAAVAIPSTAAEESSPGESIQVSGQTNEYVSDGSSNRMRYVGNPAPAGYDGNYQLGPSITVPSPEDSPVTIEGTLDLSTMASNGSVGAVGLYDIDALAAGGTAHKQDASIFVSYRSAGGGYYDIGVSDGDAGGGEFIQEFHRFTAEKISELNGVVNVRFVVDGTADPASCASDESDVTSADGCMTLIVEDVTLSDSYGTLSPSGVDVEFGGGAHPGWYSAWSGEHDPTIGIGYELTITPASAAALPTPAPAPAASSDELQQIIEDDGVQNDSSGFTSPNGEKADDAWTFSTNSNGEVPVQGNMAWNSGDSYVDVYGYSTPVFLGTFPIVDGVVDLAGLDLSALGVGAHDLVFVGQSSADLGVVSVFISAAALAATDSAAALAATGMDAASAGILGGTLLVLGVFLLLFRRRVSV